MNKPHIIALINGLILIIVGLFSFFSNPEKPFTALIGPIVGLILILSFNFLKNYNRKVAHFVAGLTLIFGLMATYLGFKSTSIEDYDKRNRRIVVFSIMAISSLSAISYYTARFILIKKGKLQTDENII